MRGEYAGNNAKGIGYLVSDDRDESDCIWIERMVEDIKDIKWNNSVIQRGEIIGI